MNKKILAITVMIASLALIGGVLTYSEALWVENSKKIEYQSAMSTGHVGTLRINIYSGEIQEATIDDLFDMETYWVTLGYDTDYTEKKAIIKL